MVRRSPFYLLEHRLAKRSNCDSLLHPLAHKGCKLLHPVFQCFYFGMQIGILLSQLANFCF